uniref:Chemokine interleukin-8-like domain-containing protein n=1 Tax=Monopterus albus TaxID=43700 RepID=A0A3Q3R6J0_MONAL
MTKTRYATLPLFSEMSVILFFKEPMKSCCTQYHPSPVPFKVLKYYRIQDNKQYCNIKAIIFTTVRNRLVCANPDSEWVQYAIGSLHYSQISTILCESIECFPLCLF